MELEGVAPSSPVCRAATLLLSYSPVAGPARHRAGDSSIPASPRRSRDLSVEPEGVAPSSPACRTSVLLLNYGSVVGVTGIAPAASRSRTARSAPELHPGIIGGLASHSIAEREGLEPPTRCHRATRLAAALLVQPDSLHTHSSLRSPVRPSTAAPSGPALTASGEAMRRLSCTTPLRACWCAQRTSPLLVGAEGQRRESPLPGAALRAGTRASLDPSRGREATALRRSRSPLVSAGRAA